MSALCGNCGARMTRGANFCWKCGAPRKLVIETYKRVRETCEIVVTEGLTGTDRLIRCPWFCAKATGPHGEYVAAQSAGFYCPTGVPEPQYAGDPHEELVNQLIKNGWTPLPERRPAWWNQRFSREIWLQKCVSRKLVPQGEGVDDEERGWYRSRALTWRQS